jgi:hypothetical protein
MASGRAAATADDPELTFNAYDGGLSSVDRDVRLTGETAEPGSTTPEGRVFIGREVVP